MDIDYRKIARKALEDQSCLIGVSGTTVSIDCETREEAEAIMEWLIALSVSGGAGESGQLE